MIMWQAHVLYLPFESSHPGNNWPANAKVDHLVKSEIYGSKELMAQVKELRMLRSTQPPGHTCFLHTDIWINNILCHTRAAGLPPDPEKQPAINVLDFEFGLVIQSTFFSLSLSHLHSIHL